MPELPEVEASRLLLQERCVGRKITSCCSLEMGGGPRDGCFDDIVIAEGVSMTKFNIALKDRVIRAVNRHGKQLWLQLSGQGPHILLHFGMTGSIVIEGVAGISYQTFSVDAKFPPKFSKLVLELEGGVRIAFADPRRLGRILLRSDPLGSKPLNELAPDAFLAPPSLAEFGAALSKVAAPVKALLLDQNRVVSGVGNWIADEVSIVVDAHHDCWFTSEC